MVRGLLNSLLGNNICPYTTVSYPTVSGRAGIKRVLRHIINHCGWVIVPVIYPYLLEVEKYVEASKICT